MIKIENFEVGQHRAPFIIAEMSGNHNQSLERALEIVEAIAKTGRMRWRFRPDTPDTMMLDLSEVSRGTIITNIYLGGMLWKQYVKLRN